MGASTSPKLHLNYDIAKGFVAGIVVVATLHPQSYYVFGRTLSTAGSYWGFYRVNLYMVYCMVVRTYIGRRA